MKEKYKKGGPNFALQRVECFGTTNLDKPWERGVSGRIFSRVHPSTISQRNESQMRPLPPPSLKSHKFPPKPVRYHRMLTLVKKKGRRRRRLNTYNPSDDYSRNWFRWNSYRVQYIIVVVTWTIPHGIVCFEMRQTDGGEERMTGDRGAFGAMAIGCHHRLLVCVARSRRLQNKESLVSVFWKCFGWCEMRCGWHSIREVIRKHLQILQEACA